EPSEWEPLPSEGMKIFISYAHEKENPARAERVRLLAERLRGFDLDVLIDQDNPFPALGWLDWMKAQIEAAEVGLIVCSQLYHKRYNDQDSSDSYGAQFEGRVIRNRFNIRKERKYVPILFEGDGSGSIPVEMLDLARFELHTFSADDPGFVGLVRRLT